MEALLEAIFGNFMIVLIIIGGIVGFLKDKSEKGKQQKNQSESPFETPNPTAAPSTGRDYQTSRHKPAEQVRRQSHQSAPSVGEQRAEQMKQLVGRMQTGTSKTPENVQPKKIEGNTATAKRSKPVKSQRPDAFKKKLKSNLTRDGLVDSIIMAEVLGSPRATKPYRSVIQQRKRNQ
ncbi:MAG TPA: hypothetical protein VK091_03590 [Virgibacillus sp.]|nr:hypothetical protein [Virgibacillus sp.]